ncbi:phosphatase 2C-like domain-containing protein [Panaeolus papilionaceus]|nr:phosphatase 2C-like domain-containing protein [Panaeolus papilionaceus]
MSSTCRRTFTQSIWSANLLKTRRYVITNVSTRIRIQRRWLLLCGGILTGSVIYSRSTIFLDSRNEDDGKSIVRDFPVTTWRDIPGRRVNPGKWNIKRMDGAQLASNQPAEDFFSCADLEYTPTLKLLAISMFDGHNGPQTANFLSDALPRTVALNLRERLAKQVMLDNMVDVVSGRLFSREEYDGQTPDESVNNDPILEPEVIDEAIKEAFVKLDDHIVHETAQRVLGLSKEEYAALQTGESTDASPSRDDPFHRKLSRTEAANVLEYAHSGSCALMALYDPTHRTLKIAHTGDLRAVLGRRVSAPLKDPNQQNANDTTSDKVIWETHVLSADHTAKNPSEAARLTALHPDEPELLKNGRTLGWGPSRAFGDASMKWPIPVQKRMDEEFLGNTPRGICKTPPYFTAEPEITTFQIQKGDFMVIATDGLWDCLTSEEVVGLTGWWVNEQNKRVLKGMKPKVNTLNVETKDGVKIRGTLFETILRNDDARLAVLEPKELPVKFGDGYKDTPMYPYWGAKKQFVNVDKNNVGKHLIRNALGGADEDLRGALLATRPPRSRRVRDDITVFVVFFD